MVKIYSDYFNKSHHPIQNAVPAVLTAEAVENSPEKIANKGHFPAKRSRGKRGGRGRTGSGLGGTGGQGAGGTGAMGVIIGGHQATLANATATVKPLLEQNSLSAGHK